MQTEPDPLNAPDTAIREALESLPDAVTVFDYELRVLYVNRLARAHLEAAHIDPASVVGRALLEVWPSAAGSQWETTLRAAAADHTTSTFERYSVALQCWTETRIVPAESSIIALTRDVAERHESDLRAADSQAVLYAILNSTTDAVFVKDREGKYLAINIAGAATNNWTPEHMIGKSNFNLIAPELATRLREGELEVMARGEMIRAEETVIRDGAKITYLITKGPWHDYEGQVGGIVGIGTDISARRKREEESALLAEAGRALAESLDYRVTLEAVANLVTPLFADWCSVQVLDKAGKLETVAVVHADPQKVRWAREFSERYPTEPDSPTGPPNVVRTGKSELYSDISPEMLFAAAKDSEHLRLLNELQMRSVLIVPMSAHGRTVGAITLIGAESGRRYAEADLPLIEEIARRSALAIQHAELFEAASSASRAKSEFLASMSHELRTPLNAIIGYAELLGDGITGPVVPAQQDQLLRIRASAGHLLGLINEVLSFTRMEAGAEVVAIHDLDVEKVLDDSVALVRPMAIAKKLAINIRYQPDGQRLNTDALKLRQIFVNLLTNAVKFTDAGSITLAAQCDEGVWRFSVTDTGIGISPEHLRRIFEPFWQVEQHASRRVGGTGLGLSVTRRLSRLLGGDVTVQSGAGEGTTFVVTLPPPSASRA